MEKTGKTISKVYRYRFLGYALQGIDAYYLILNDEVDLKHAMNQYTKWLDVQFDRDTDAKFAGSG